ncbi:L,D-transpeptidase family protein [Azospirillum picis]|uniref:Murein L,D-transpeptidase YcbB/YkuD n=1 Tax=Azospirillum picis TaxID=488438 RepID=A0ABU0ME95_9PROT|nr:L,D-transpeptidase family protein [Azospirillum picis]MBP2297921.1 murein L,D-transpeptidase YcbB/YkuD [Azospirillum picis]MDQ0531759.1 murein L,D-transpeptidase YcbB/YkuD [Azospirillum picis]
MTVAADLRPFHKRITRRPDRSASLLAAALSPALLSSALLSSALLIASLPADAAPYRDTLTGWADRLDSAAAELDHMPAQTSAPIGQGGLLKLGSSGDRVGRLAQRLVELGLLPADQVSSIFTPEIDRAVRAFQVAQRMKPDGLVGAGTRAALDRGPAEAAALMRQSAVAMRSFRDTAPDSVLVVNLTDQTTTLVRDGEEVMTMRAIVGRPSRETPLLTDRITHVIVNPTWTVPPTIMKEDKLPHLRATGTPGIQHAVVYLDGQEVAPETVDWQGVSPGRVRIVQQPGNHNALGRFRFNLTNPYDIYLHGTNEPRLFARELRSISSGCVRLEDPRLLAETLLQGTPITPARIDRMLDRAQPQWIKLPTPMPVQFVYWIATVTADGSVRLHPDIYDRIDEMPVTGPAAEPLPSTGVTPAVQPETGRASAPPAPDRSPA